MTEEYHEHPDFDGQYHRAVWIQTWVSGDTSTTDPPEGAPVSCAVCGRTRIIDTPTANVSYRYTDALYYDVSGRA